MQESIIKPAERSFFLDNAKGILIFLVVFGHFLLPFRTQPFLKLLSDFIYIFHMPAFIFISGYLTKFISDKSSSQLKIILAYLFFNFLMMLFSVHYLKFELSLLTPYFSYWYLPALFAWRAVTPFLAKHSEALPVALLISLLVGYHQEFGNQLAISRIIGFYPFFLAGYLTSKDRLECFIGKRKFLHRIAGSAIILAGFFISARLSLHELVMDDLLFYPYLNSDKLIVRIQILLACMAIMVAAATLIPQRKLRFLSQWGRNSLGIYVLHRYIPFLSESFLKAQSSQLNMAIAALALSFLTTLLLGTDRINSRLNAALGYISEAFKAPHKETDRAVRLAVELIMVLLFASLVLFNLTGLNKKKRHTDVIHKVLTTEQQQLIDRCVEIAYVGDLILLRDQVREACDSESDSHNFKPAFAYAKSYLSEADLSIGVFEGPLAGSDKGYSTSNYGDNIPVYLNFPDSFALAVKDAGIDLVTLANNHLLDMEQPGIMRTLAKLEETGLKHVGAYRNDDEKKQISLIGVKGLKIALLAYTIPGNYYPEKYFFETNKTITKVLVARSSKYFAQALEQVKSDFNRARELKPDFIIVLAHMGTQFIHKTDEFQDTWNDIFVKEGADVVLGDHSHAVQPIEFRKTNSAPDNQTTSLIVNCPGNFVNSYIKDNGDATAIVKIYLDPQSKEVAGAGIVPMWTQGQSRGIHRALPIYSILTDPGLNLSRHDMERVSEVQALVTRVMLGTSLSLDQVQKEYFLFPDGYYRRPVEPLTALSDALLNKPAMQLLAASSKTVFVGDSLTDGCKNGGYGWFEPLARAMPHSNYAIEARGGATILTLLNNADQIAAHCADVYVIAAGTNDLRYRAPTICALTSDKFIARIEKLANKILHERPDARLIFVSPWPSLVNDPYNKIPPDKKAALFAEFTKALQQYCRQNGHIFADPAADISAAIEQKPINYYLKDHIHPNARHGIKLYSQKFLESL